MLLFKKPWYNRVIQRDKMVDYTVCNNEFWKKIKERKIESKKRTPGNNEQCISSKQIKNVPLYSHQETS